MATLLLEIKNYFSVTMSFPKDKDGSTSDTTSKPSTLFV